MTVEFVPAERVRVLTQRIGEARQQAIEHFGMPPAHAEPRYWEGLFEANAAAVLAILPSVQLAAGFVVRYRFFGQRGRDLLVRPFVARPSTDVEAVRRVLDWHAPPDAIAPALSGRPTQDVDLLYRHFSFPHTAEGTFEYWLAMQELWSSQRWVHSHVIASADELSQITAGDGWAVVHPVEAYAPAVVRGDGGARLAVLVHCPLERVEIALQQIEVGTDQSIQYDEPILVASGRSGYLA